MVLGIQFFAGRASDGGPVLDAGADEEVVRVERGSSVALGRRLPESPGTLFITNRRVIWLSDLEKEKGYSVDFVSISLHAVSRDPEAYPQPCIYTQIELEEEEEEMDGSDSESEENTFDLSKISEMRFIPSDPNQLDLLFEVFCQCAELNPDPNAEMEEEEEENSWVFGDDIAQGGMDWQTLINPIGQANGDNNNLAHNILNLQINDERFEDAEESDKNPKP